jgi:hypothetical protein
MRRFLPVAICAVFPSVGLADSAVYDATLKGKSCKEFQQQLGCEFKVGKDLEFSIDAIGTPYTTITFVRVNYGGDYYVKYGLLHGCLVVTHGKNSPLFMQDFAFVSPKAGKVYSKWEACQGGL